MIMLTCGQYSYPTSICAGVGIKLRLLADLIESTFDYSSVASAMKEDLWQT